MEHPINNNDQSSQSGGFKKIRWGILGTGKIANKFASEFSHTASAELAAVASRDLERARSFAAAHQIPKAYGSYEELLNQEDIDIIYIGLVNSAHYPVTRQALLAGKPVLCEKPFTLHVEQTQELIQLARQKNLFLMEGLWTRTFPVIDRVKEIVSSQKYGKVTLAQMDFGFIGNLDSKGRLMNPELGGSALYDVGIYPLTTAQHFLGDITEFQAMATLS
ncbi:MAG: Gfo/Idh/MocA family oxidoreductase, partial [Verrucomicrobia bacterium]|nr:Gfo/Idh/MocA family oxidoreductase [Verrucomicrobiota bacterium]